MKNRLRRLTSLAALMVFLVLLAQLASAEGRDQLGSVNAVRKWSHPDYTRVVVELDRAVDAEIVRLPAGTDVSGKRPERLYVDLEGIWVGREYEDGIPVRDGLLLGLRLGQNTRTKARLVIDLERYERHRLLVLRSPHRVVVDVYGARENPEMLSWPKPEGARVPRRLPTGFRLVQTVVIDPGHGGKDPGATGIGGMREKDVNLRLSKLLRDRLRQAGLEVVLTRGDDRTLELEERTAIAESAGADLFVSIHANASAREQTRGIEIYYLDENHQRHTLEVAARENGVPREEMDSLQRTLAQLRIEELSDHSARLAGSVHAALLSGLSARYRDVEDLGVKKGPFYVLFLSSIPSILVESGFLTNVHDARLLGERAYLEQVAGHIAEGVVRYRDSAGKLAASFRSPRSPRSPQTPQSQQAVR